MSGVIAKYRDQIVNLKPLDDSKFIYNSNNWSKLHTEAKTLVIDFEDKDIARKDVIKAFDDFYRGKKNYLYPFIMTMIWGFADTGYGTFRTNKYIESSNNKKNIQSAFQNIDQGNIDKAYHLLMQIDGLNVSYVSKLLYFATRARKQEDYVLIFDARVARAIVKVFNLSISNFLKIGPSTKYEDYRDYNKLIHQWAQELNVEAENIEMFLFNNDF